MSSTIAPIVVELVRDKETKNTVRYAEPDGESLVGTVYFPKPTVATLGNPERLSISIAARAA